MSRGKSFARTRDGRVIASALKNVAAFLITVCVGIAAGCVLEAEDVFERVAKRDALKGKTSGQ